MVYFTGAVSAVCNSLCFGQYDHRKKLMGNYALVDNTCIRDQHCYHRCFMEDLQAKQYNIPRNDTL